MKDNENFGPSVKQIILNCKKKCLNLISIFYGKNLEKYADFTTSKERSKIPVYRA